MGNTEYSISKNNQAGKNAQMKQLKGRILLSAVLADSRSRIGWRYCGHQNDDISYAMSSIEPGTEYQTAMTLMNLHDTGCFLKVIIDTISNHDNKGIGAKKAKAAVQILHQLGRHKENLNEIGMLPQTDRKLPCMKAYISAFAWASNAGAEELFLSLERKRLIHVLTESSDTELYLFQLLPFFACTGYIFHIMENHEVKNTLVQVDLEKLRLEEKRLLGSRQFLASRILKSVTSYATKYAISVCAENHEAFLFLEYLAKSLPERTWDEAIYDSKNIIDAKMYIQTMELLTDYPRYQTKTLTLIAWTKYDRVFVKTLYKKIQTTPRQYVNETERLSLCMTAAWVLGRDDVLKFEDSAWWDDSYEGTILYAMIHKWDRFLSGLADSEKLQAVVAYLGTKCSQINANLLSDRQLIKICEQDMLSAPFPEWMKSATYDQIRAFHEIQQSTDMRLKASLTGIFQKLSESLRPETAGKRMLQFVQARNSCTDRHEISTQEAEEIVSCLCEKDLYAWAAGMFSFKPSHVLASMALPHIRGNRVFSEAKTEQDVLFVLRNLDFCRDGLEKAKEMFCQTDCNVLELKEKLQFEDAFYQKYRKESTEFLLASADIARTYADGLNESDLKKFRLIVKAAMCRKLKELKFHDGDLKNEIGFPVDEKTTDAWICDMNNTCKDKFHGVCMEDSSFNGIMTIGDRPHYTCMNYRDGSYRKCLMSYFDANKKILYRIDGSGKTIARAIFRFTKASYMNLQKHGSRLEFIDVEDTTEINEFPILFLERMYSGYQGQDRKILAKSVIQAAKEKASSMGITLVLAHDYLNFVDINENSFISGHLSFYITKSKSSAQYLDSFGGEKTSAYGEDCYMKADCFICTTN